MVTPVDFAFVSAKLCDVFPDGTSALVTRGILNLTQRTSHEEPSPVVPGEPVTVSIELDATSWIWEPGHRVRLDIAGSDFPSSWPPPEAGTLTVDRGGSSLVLPVLRGPSPDPAPAFAQGDPAPHEVEHVTWYHAQDIVSREHRVTIDHGGVRGAGRHPRQAFAGAGADGLDYLDRYGGTIEVRWDEPGIACATGGTVYELGWPEVRVRTESRGTLRSDATTWYVALELEVRENGETIATRRWERTVPRHLA